MSIMIYNKSKQTFQFIMNKSETYGEFVYLKNLKTNEVHLFSKKYFDDNFRKSD